MDQFNIKNFDFFKALLEALPNPIFYKDRSGYYRFCNSAFVKFLGLEMSEIIDKNVYEIAPHELAVIYDKADQDAYTQDNIQIYESKIHHADGTLHDVIFSKAVHFDQHHEAIGIVGIMQDITEKKAAKREVDMLHKLKDAFLFISQSMLQYESEQELLNALLIQVQSIFAKCSQATVLQLNSSDTLTVIAQIGYDEDDMLNFTIPLKESFIFRDLKDKISTAHVVNNIIEFTNQGYKKVALPLSKIPVCSSLVVPIWINDNIKWIFALDSSENYAFNETDRNVADYIREQLPLVYRIHELYLKTLRLSRYDDLTNLINRRYFDTLHEACYHNALQEKTFYSLVLFDLDGLKHVNDLYGHQAGDAYLIAFANWLKAALIDGDCYARLGGDEFVGLFYNISKEELTAKIKSLRKTFEIIPIVEMPHVYFGSFSFGVSNFPDDSDNRSKLFQIADVRMYKDKRR